MSLRDLLVDAVGQLDDVRVRENALYLVKPSAVRSLRKAAGDGDRGPRGGTRGARRVRG